MTRSLVFKTLVYAIVVFFLAIPPAMWVARQILESGRRFDPHSPVELQLDYIVREIQRSWTGQPPAPGRLAEWEAPFRAQLRFVPWSETSLAIPVALRTEARIFDPIPPDKTPHHWARVDVLGKPVGALELIPLHRSAGRRSRPPRAFMPQMAWAWLVGLMLAIVPPLWFWVLRPLRQMVAVAHRLASGDMVTPVQVDRRDEFGTLERAFEHMRVELKRAIDQRERLLTDVSHEIRGPLARMMIALPLLQQQGAPDPILQIFENELRTVDDLVGEVLSVARGNQAPGGVKVPLDLAELARVLVEDRQVVAAYKDVKLTSELANAPITGDARLVSRILGNLLDNAVKYAEPGCTVHVVTHCEGDEAVARIIDDGPGIAPEHLPAIFDPFYRPDTSRSRETGGVGLGLSIVKRLVEAHGGKVTLASPGERGTTAEIRLPLRLQG